MDQSNKGDTLGDRMKGYELASDYRLIRRMPMIIRVDGKAFHTLTRNMDRPWDSDFINTMMYTAIRLINTIQGAKLAYAQSDEISILVTDYDELNTESWFGKRKSKMESISASYASIYFNKYITQIPTTLGEGSDKKYPDVEAVFDSRAFIVPKEEVCNYFIWRQQDATRNSIQSQAQAHFSHKDLQNLNTDQLQELLFCERDINWNDNETWLKRGYCVVKSEDKFVLDKEIPIFSKDRNYIERFI